MANPSEIGQIVQEILADMPLKEKAIIANLDEDKVPYLQYAFDACIRGQLGKDDEMSKDVMHRIWEVLQETHRVRVVKKEGQAWTGPALRRRRRDDLASSNHGTLLTPIDAAGYHFYNKADVLDIQVSSSSQC